jgi:hypothetical protein
MNRATDDRKRFLINRSLIILTVAAILSGLSFDHWAMVLRNAVLICYSCIGLG